MNVYEIVTSEIIKKLESGTVPWRQPWISKGAVSWNTQKPYRGINALLLEPGEYATFDAIQAAGGHVKKGAKGHLVVFWKMQNSTETNDAGEPVTKTVPLLRYYKVFEINTQAEGLKSKRKDAETFAHDPIESAEAIRRGYKNAPTIGFAPGRAFYRPSTDEISVPAIEDYRNPNEFYSTLFHEMTHSTGHSSRLGRLKTGEVAAFGSESYSKEELVAEIGAAMLCGKAGIVQETIENSAAYVSYWLKRLREDSRLIVTASSQAQKAADYILGEEES